MTKEIRLVICIPSTGTWFADFGMCLVFLTNHLAARPTIHGKQMHYTVHNKRGSILANMRQRMVETALENKATHLLFIDSDQTFPADLVERLLAHKKQVVACNVATKMIPATPTARQRGSEGAGVPVYTSLKSPELELVWRIGTGIMLIDLNIFKRPELTTGPWFTQRWSEALKSYVGEDWAFCERLEAARVKIYIDHKVSLEIGHVGLLNYGHDLVLPPELKEVG